jgi:hypothetical protein
MTITVERVGRRSYLRGNTFAVKDAIRAAGGHWDADQRAWWVSKAEVAAELAGKAAAPASQPDSSGAEKLSDDTRVLGKARYQGREYLLLWEGTTKRGPAAKLAFRDGSKAFWASHGEYEITKRYESRERYGRTEHMTIGRLELLRERYAAAAKSGRISDSGRVLGTRYECSECGEYVTAGDGSCWETGHAH